MCAVFLTNKLAIETPKVTELLNKELETTRLVFRPHPYFRRCGSLWHEVLRAAGGSKSSKRKLRE